MACRQAPSFELSHRRLEGRPQDKGRQAVVRHVGADVDGASERGAIDVTPTDTNVRTRVHEYGGGAYALAPESVGGGVVYVDFATQRLFHKRDGAEPTCLTPEGSCPNGQYRFADGCFDATLGFVCVREDHGPAGDAPPKEVVNEVVAVPMDGSGRVKLLATGGDFFGHPRISPDGTKLAYVTWDHPNMPCTRPTGSNSGVDLCRRARRRGAADSAFAGTSGSAHVPCALTRFFSQGT